MSTFKSLLKSIALALALTATIALPGAVQARSHRSSKSVYHHNLRPIFTGVVTKRRSNNRFDVRINGKTYNVHTNRRLPSGLSTDDLVRIHGYRFGNNDIRDAWVTIIRNG